jgi:hypothetical protein
VQTIDYTKPENYTVDFFIGHKKVMEKKKEVFKLITKWKGYSCADDDVTPECVIVKSHEMPDLVMKYLKENYKTAGDLMAYIIEERQHFPTSLINAVNQLLDNLMNQQVAAF